MPARAVIRLTNDPTDPAADQSASGAGPDPMLTGTQASTSSDGRTVDLSLDNPDLSQVAADGSHVIRLYGTSTTTTTATPAYVAISRILAVDNVNKTVTVENPVIPSATGQGWSIGGKILVGSDAGVMLNEAWRCKRGPWTIEVAATGQPYDIYTPVDDNNFDWDDPAADAGNTWAHDAHEVVSNSATAKPTLRIFTTSIGWRHNASGSRRPVFVKRLVFEFAGSGGTDQPLLRFYLYGYHEVRDCEFYGNNGVDKRYGVQMGGSAWWRVVGCKFVDCLLAIEHRVETYLEVADCFFDSCDTGIRCDGQVLASRCIFRNCGYAALVSKGVFANSRVRAYDCTFDGCGRVYLRELYSNTTTYIKYRTIQFHRCIFHASTGYHFEVVTDGSPQDQVMYNLARAEHQAGPFFGCAWGPATSGHTNDDVYFGVANQTAGVTFTADPFVDRLNGDYSLNDDPNGGKLLKDAGWPQTWPGLSNTTSYPDIGAVESQAGTGGSTGGSVSLARIFAGI